MKDKKRIWIHWVFLGAIFLYLCLFGVETAKFFGGGPGNVILTANLNEAVNSNVKVEPVTHALDSFDISWKKESDSKYISGENIFRVDVNGIETRIEFLFDAANGKKVGDWAAWNPQLFLGEIEIGLANQNPVLISTNSLNDTLEWDYGICTRKLQLKPNSLIEFYVFNDSPGESIRIKSNKSIRIKSNNSGNLIPEGYYAIDAQGNSLKGFTIVKDEKQLPLSAFENVIFPVIVDDSYSSN